MPWTGIASLQGDISTIADPIVAGIVSCVGLSTRVCVLNPWCFLGAVIACGIVFCAYACIRDKCWESSTKVKATLLSGQQSSTSVDGTQQTSEAANQINQGMNAVLSGNFGQSTTQYKVVSGTLYRGYVSAQALKNQWSLSFRTCECTNPKLC
jgi:hypothetical protein